jgi:hypothetical protein
MPTRKFFKMFFCFLLFEVTFTSFFKEKKIQKKSQNSRNQGFSNYFCLMTERSGSGSKPLTNGSGSGRPKTCGSGSGTLLLNVRNLHIALTYYHLYWERRQRRHMSGFTGEQASHNLQVQPPHVTTSAPTYGYQSWHSFFQKIIA